MAAHERQCQCKTERRWHAHLLARSLAHTYSQTRRIWEWEQLQNGKRMPSTIQSMFVRSFFPFPLPMQWNEQDQCSRNVYKISQLIQFYYELCAHCATPRITPSTPNLFKIKILSGQIGEMSNQRKIARQIEGISEFVKNVQWKRSILCSALTSCRPFWPIQLVRVNNCPFMLCAWCSPSLPESPKQTAGKKPAAATITNNWYAGDWRCSRYVRFLPFCIVASVSVF